MGLILKRNFCLDVNGRFESMWCVTLYKNCAPLPAGGVVLEGGCRRPGGHGPAHHLPELLGRLHRNLARIPVVIHRKGVRAEYSGRKLAKYWAESISVKFLSFGDERKVRLLPNIR